MRSSSIFSLDTEEDVAKAVLSKEGEPSFRKTSSYFKKSIFFSTKSGIEAHLVKSKMMHIFNNMRYCIFLTFVNY